MSRALLRAILPVLMAMAAHADDPLAALSPPPQVVDRLTGAAVALPVSVERVQVVKAGRALLERFKGRLPGGTLPAEGYLLETGPGGTAVVAADEAGERHARRTLAHLGPTPPRAAFADWPACAWRGLHVLDSGPESLPLLKRLVHEKLGPARANVFVYEIDYNFKFSSHPEIKGAWTRSQVGELVAACRAEGIRLIPEINCLGHQSWKTPPGPLLVAHPEFEEPPDAKVEQADPTKEAFYCRSWCPSNPKVHPFVCDLIDELLDAFQADAFHAGMDEVFVIASTKCPFCNGLNPADAYMHAVNDLHDHLAKRGATMLMWGDRLLDGKATGYGEWEGATNGTDHALLRIPKDIIVCDWHYEPMAKYPSLTIFPEAGFRVWPSVWKDPEGARKFMEAARARKDPRVLGALATTWINGGRMAARLLGEPAVDADRGDGEMKIAVHALQVLADAWHPSAR